MSSRGVRLRGAKPTALYGNYRREYADAADALRRATLETIVVVPAMQHKQRTLGKKPTNTVLMMMMMAMLMAVVLGALWCGRVAQSPIRCFSSRNGSG